MAIEASEFRKVLGQFASGVTVVTSAHEGALQGMTVSAFSSVSLDPPLVLFCADKRSRTPALVAAGGAFAVSVLREDQRALSELFAGRGSEEERQEVLASADRSPSGCPVLHRALAWLDCRVVQAHEAGDHVIYVGEVRDAGVGELGGPLLYFRSTYQALEPAWRWRDRYVAREHAVPFHDLVDFFERMQHEGPYAGLLEKLARLSSPAADARCLDLGCGPGRLTRELGARCREAIGVDSSAAMVARAAMRVKAAGIANVHYLEASVTALPFPAHSFDVVVAASLLFHSPEPVLVLREAARMLREGGCLALLEPSASMTHAAMSAFLEEEDHDLPQLGGQALLAWADAAEARPRFSEEQLVSDLESVGFASIVQERELGGLATLTLAWKR